jgi:hypothetical protein
MVSQGMRDSIAVYLQEKFPRLGQRDLSAFRFIDSNVMEDTGMDLDHFYSTTIVQALDHLQQSLFISVYL